MNTSPRACRQPPAGERLPASVALENIEGLRCRAGIDDVELRDAIGRLHAGDVVNLTFLKDAATLAGETLAVEITFARAGCFRGRLTDRPSTPALGKLRRGAAVVFRTMHIHSIARRGPADE